MLRRAAFALMLCAGLLVAPALRAGEVGKTLGKYSMAGAGVGALLGSAAATVPYLQSKQPYDFLTGAGIGMLAGCGVGFILGVVDLANPADAAMAPAEGWALAWQPQGMSAAYSVRF